MKHFITKRVECQFALSYYYVDALEASDIMMDMMKRLLEAAKLCPVSTGLKKRVEDITSIAKELKEHITYGIKTQVVMHITNT